jgi:hypothetical protein
MTIEEIKAHQDAAITDADDSRGQKLEYRERALLRIALWEIALQLAQQRVTMIQIANTRGDPR